MGRCHETERCRGNKRCDNRKGRDCRADMFAQVLTGRPAACGPRAFQLPRPLALVCSDLMSGSERVARAQLSSVAVGNEADNIVKALLMLVQNPELRQQMGAAGRASAETSWSWPAHVGPWRTVIQHVIDGRRD